MDSRTEAHAKAIHDWLAANGHTLKAQMISSLISELNRLEQQLSAARMKVEDEESMHDSMLDRPAYF